MILVVVAQEDRAGLRAGFPAGESGCGKWVSQQRIQTEVVVQQEEQRV